MRTAIIVQSPADLKNAMQIYSELSGNSVDFLVVGSTGVFKSLEDVDHSVFFIVSPRKSAGIIRYIYDLIKIRFKLRALVSKYDQVFYPSLLNSVVTSVFIFLAQKNKIKTIKYSFIYDDLIENTLSLASKKDILLSACASKILYLLTGNPHFGLIKYSSKYMPICYILPDHLYTIKKLPIIGLKPILEFKKNDNSRRILFLDTVPGYLISNYELWLKEILNAILKSHMVYVKKHPTHGVSFDWRWNKSIVVLDNFEPLSSYDCSGFDAVIAISSMGLTEVFGSNPVALIQACEFKDPKLKSTYIRYLSSNDVSNQITFVESCQELENFLEDKIIMASI